MKLYIAGDFCPTADSEKHLVAGVLTAAFGTLPKLVKDADGFILNLECALTEAETRIRKYGPNLKGAPVCAQTLRELGVTDVGLSNNHFYDFSHQGVVDTLAALDSAGIRYTGIGENEQAARKPHYMQLGNLTVAVVAVCEHEYSYALPDREGCWGFDPFETMEDVSIAKENSDFVVVMYHGGKEQCEYPSPRLRKACQGLVRAGADLVLCQHSHCIGVREDYRGGNILYGQGNFHFVGLAGRHPHWQTGLILEVELDENARASYTYHPLKVTEQGGITLCEGEEKQRILTEFFDRTAVLQDRQAWTAQWNAFCERSRQTYERAVATAFAEDKRNGQTPCQLFPHYLDCEAHTDVWRQLYPTWNGDDTLDLPKP